MGLHAFPYLCDGGHLTSQPRRRPCLSQHARTTFVLLLSFVVPAVICLFLCSSVPTPQDQCVCAHQQWGKTAMLGCSLWIFACVFVDLNFDQLPGAPRSM
jgi:hypothetical protein